MPPTPDKQLEERILKAAQQLWKSHGEKALTLRAVAEKAGTTTPTVYKRFRNKEALRLALAYRFREELTDEVLSSTSIEQMPRRYLSWVEVHPREYGLLGAYWGHFYSTPRPVRTWLIAQLAARFGGAPEEYLAVYDAIFLLCHGASNLLTSAPDQDTIKATQTRCTAVCDKLIENIAMLRSEN